MKINPNAFVYAYREKVLFIIMKQKEDGSLGEYIYVTYRDMWERIKNYGSGLRALNLIPISDNVFY